MKTKAARKACLRLLLTGLAVSLVCALPSPASSKAARTDADAQRQCEERLRQDLTFLASDACEGRGPTTEGINKAADYVADQFRKAGLKPGWKGGYFQPFTVGLADGKVVLSGPAGKRIELVQGKHFLPLGFDQSGKAAGELVFAGYGLSSKAPAYDDYTGIDVKGKVVVLLRDRPLVKAARESKEIDRQAPIVAKINAAKARGAVAVLLLNDAETAGKTDDLVDYSYTRMDYRQRDHLLAVTLKRSLLASLLPQDRSLASIEKGIDSQLKPDSFAVPGWKVEIEIKKSAKGLPLKNVVGVLEGAGPLAKETIVVGAHYDHLGYGGPSSLAASKKQAIHHGADDNGSGTTAMLELARRFAAVPNRQGRRLVFIAFSGEELGLFGSKAYCDNPVFPLKDTAAMFNLDMVGRLRNNKLLTEGHGTAKPFKELIDGLARKYDLTLSPKASGMGPSDHASFCAQKVPVLFFWTGNHPDYHRPTDTVDRILFPGMRRVVDMSEEAITALTKIDKPAFIEVKGLAVRPSKGPRLGIRPGYGEDKPGVEVDGVVAGGPADRAGVKDGDLIVGIAGKEVKDITTYMQAMGTQKLGTTIDVSVVRKGKKVTLKVKLD